MNINKTLQALRASANFCDEAVDEICSEETPKIILFQGWENEDMLHLLYGVMHTSAIAQGYIRECARNDRRIVESIKVCKGHVLETLYVFRSRFTNYGFKRLLEITARDFLS
jgi:hypothetical protein